MAGQYPDDDEQTPSSAPWYNRTPAVLGASGVGLAVIVILIAAVTFVSGQFNEPQQAPLNFVEPSFSATATGLSTPTTTTTATITSTSPPVTTDIDTPSSTTSSSDPSDTSGTDTSTPRRTARTHESDDEESTPRTTRRGPRTNVTRTLYPQP